MLTMQKPSGFGYHHHLHLMPPNANLSGFDFQDGYLTNEPVYRNPRHVEDPTSINYPVLPILGLQKSKASEPNNSRNWFYNVPHFHNRGFAPVMDSSPKEKLPIGLTDLGQQRVLTGPSQKRFLVFDQSGDKTTLIYTSGIQTPVLFGASLVPKPPTFYIPSKKGPTMGSNCPSKPSMNEEIIDGSSKDVIEDEMHEDTEELNALLCSDNDSDFPEDDEETSTGHSPSTMTDNGVRDLIEETGEEVDSFPLPTKRRKLFDGGSQFIPISDNIAPISLKTSVLEDGDAGSSCGNDDKKLCKEELGSSWSGCKRPRKEKIHETVSILQRIIPGVNGKDAIIVLDEAIHYLRSLKVKAKALGLDAL